jgi:hypothetical protein
MGLHLEAGLGDDPSGRLSKSLIPTWATGYMAPDHGIEPRSTRFRALRAHLGDPVNWCR